MMLNRLRELRQEHNYTLEYVAQQLGLRNQYVSNYELGKRRPDLETLTKFAHFYHVSTDYLLGNTEKREPPALSDVELSPSELQLLELFRALSPEEQDQVIAAVHAVEEEHR